MGNIYTKLKNYICSCCSNGFLFKSSCCSSTEVMDIEIKIEPKQEKDTELNVNCFGCGLKKLSKVSYNKED
jgi:hypothetical protein